MITEEFLIHKINQTGINFGFLLPPEFKPFFKVIYEKVKHLNKEHVERRFIDLWMMSGEEWNKKYGFRGYPPFADWIEIIIGQKPLTEADRKLVEKKYQDELVWHVKSIINIVSQITEWNIKYYFPHQYLKKEIQHLRQIINGYLKIKHEPSDDEIIEIGFNLKHKLDNDKKIFQESILEIALNQNLLTIN